MQHEEARLRAVIDTAIDGVILVDSRGRVLMCNPACERLFGYDVNELAGQNVSLLMPWPYRDKREVDAQKPQGIELRRPVGTDREVIGRRKDGSTFPVDLSVGEALEEGEPIFVGIIHDLTERKRTEEQLFQVQRMDTVGRLSGGIAHDFNNLLTVIVGHAEFLIEQLKDHPDLQNVAEAIAEAASRGGELTQRLLAFGRRQTLRPPEVDCNKLLEGTQRLLKRVLREDIEVKIVFDVQALSAFVDSNQLESAVLNLALDAQDAMPHGGSLTIATANVSLDERFHDFHRNVRPGQYVMITVTDEGEGMSRDVLARAFEPFFTTKEIGKNSGLGLSMVYGFVKQSNGHVAIYSEPGIGTSVRIYLPALYLKAEKLRAPQAGTAEQTARIDRKEIVLVAEDDPFVRSYAVGCLEKLGYEVVAAIDGPDVLRKLTVKEVEPDILFTDIVMPGGMSGWELAERARKIQPTLKVLLTSGYSLDALAERGRSTTTDVILAKPYRKAELAQRIREALDTTDAGAGVAE